MYSTTRTMASAWTAARVQYVMDKVYENLKHHVFAGFLEPDRAQRWREDLTYLLDEQAISEFQIQYLRPDKRDQGLGFRVSDAGTLIADDESGGLDCYALPKGTELTLVVRYRQDCPHLERVRQKMRERGWGPADKFLSGGTHDHTYSKEGYGLQRYRLGDWSYP